MKTVYISLLNKFYLIKSKFNVKPSENQTRYSVFISKKKLVFYLFLASKNTQPAYLVNYVPGSTFVGTFSFFIVLQNILIPKASLSSCFR